MGGDDFAEFYAVTFGPLCVQLHAHTGDLAEAQDVVQEAFCRALPRWKTLAEYDDPAAWVRKVAWNLATSRWRRMRRLVDLTRVQHVNPVPPPNPDRLDLMNALAALPAPQRETLVLHYIGGVSVAEIAQITGVGVGTVKSRLHRARAAMADLLTTEQLVLPADMPPPGVNQVYVTVQQRRSRNTRVAAAAIVAVVCLSVLAFSTRSLTKPPVTVIPSPSPTPSDAPSPTPSTSAEPELPVGAMSPIGAARSPQPIPCAKLIFQMTQVYTYAEVKGVARQPFLAQGQQMCADPRVRVFWATYTIDSEGVHHLYRSQAYILDQAGQTLTMNVVDPTTCWGAYFVVAGEDSIVQSFRSGPEPNSSISAPYAGHKMNWSVSVTPCPPPEPTPTATP